MNNNGYRARILALACVCAVLASCSSLTDPANLSSNEPTAQIDRGDESAVAVNMPQVPLNSSEVNEEAVNAAIAQAVAKQVAYDKEDTEAEANADKTNSILLQGTSVTFSGTGAIVQNNQITIALPGVYVISGQWDDGQIVVDLESKGTVQLVLSGANLHNKTSAPIFVVNASKTIITLQDGTENFVSDGQNYVYEKDGDDEPSAAIYSKDDLVINGTGKLTVTGAYNDGIVSKDELRITGGNISIHAVDDGLIGRDLLAIQGGQFMIQAGGDGLKSTNDEDAGKGTIVIDGGSFQIEAGSDGIQAETSLFITDGQFAIASKGGKGLKATADITITGGAYHINSADDALHSNGSLTIAAGAFIIETDDDAVHADAAVMISGGTIQVDQSYEGIESQLVTITGGEIRITSSDDGINVAGGNDGSGFRGGPLGNQSASSVNAKLLISGGYIVVNADGDGLDSNGAIEMTGGTVIVNGPTASGNGALDYDGTFAISGGFLLAAGSSGMAQAPGEQSAQPSIMIYLPQGQQAGTLLHVEDSKGLTVADFVLSKSYQTVVLSSPQLVKGETYTVFTGGSITGTQADGLYSEGEYEGGTKLATFTMQDTVTYVNESGVTTSQGMGAGPGGGRGGRGEPGRR